MGGRAGKGTDVGEGANGRVGRLKNTNCRHNLPSSLCGAEDGTLGLLHAEQVLTLASRLDKQSKHPSLTPTYLLKLQGGDSSCVPLPAVLTQSLL